MNLLGKNLIKKVFCILFLVFSAANLFSEYNSKGIPDSAEIRRTLVREWFTCPVSELKTKDSRVIENNIGQRFQVRMEERLDSYVIIVSPENIMKVKVITDDGYEFIKSPVYSEGACGSFVLYRNKVNGAPQKIQWFFNADSEVYLEFYPSGAKTYVDLVIYSCYAIRKVSVPLGSTFDRLYTASFNDIYRWTSSIVPWEKVTVVPGQYKEMLLMSILISKELPKIKYFDQGCYNEDDTLCSIFTAKPIVLKDSDGNDYYPDTKGMLWLDSEGFLKWIIDGIVKPISGTKLKIEDITRPTVNYNEISKNGVLSQDWSLSISLDVVRNLASCALDVRSYGMYEEPFKMVDVAANYFVGMKKSNLKPNTFFYMKDIGYKIEMLNGLLYVLANIEPSYFYLAAIRNSSNVKAEEFVFNQSAILFPYFDDNGHFDCVVFEKGKEYSFSDFIKLHPGTYIHLERVKSTEYFFLNDDDIE